MQKILTLVLMLLLQRAGLSQTWYLQQVAVIDVEQGKVTPGQTLVIANGQIATIQPDAKIKIPNGATLVNAAGKYVMPGLIDAHIHFFQSGGLYTRPDVVDFRWKVPYEKELSFGKENAIDYLKRYLRLGITTVADIGGPFFNFKIRDSIAKTTSPLPNVLVTGPLFSMIENDYFGADKPIEHIETIEAANRLMDSMLPYKPDFIKVWYIAAPENPVHKNYELVKHIASRSKAAGLKLLVHATELETAKLAVAAGAQVLVHSVSDTLLPFDFIASLNAKGVVVIPTLTVSTNYVKALSGMAKPHAQDLTFANAFAYGTLQHLEHIPQVLQPPLIAILRKGAMAASFKKSDSIQAVNLMRLLNAGITIATGTDAGNIGTHHASSYIQELEAMEAAGMSAAQLVKASTLGGAVALGRQPTCGTVAAGKVADLLLLDSNPLEKIAHLHSVTHVIKNGIMYKTDSLLQETPEAIVQRQLNAYNARQLEAFVHTYAQDVEIRNLKGTLLSKGHDALRQTYGPMFEQLTNLHCQIKNRVVQGNVVIDEEEVRAGSQTIKATAIYEIEAGKIKRVTFVQ